jgi:hypothetical protein
MRAEPDPAAELERLRAAVRKHRDARGHDRCWENDLELYAALPEGPPPSPLWPQLPPRCEFLARCEEYYESQTTG